MAAGPGATFGSPSPGRAPGAGIVPVADASEAAIGDIGSSSCWTQPMPHARRLPFVVAALFGGCTVSFPLQSCWFSDYAVVETATAVREEPLHVTEAMGMVVVALDATATAGDATWTLVDPGGNPRWKCHTSAAQHLQQDCSFANAEGTWTVRREWTGFTGTQQFSVRAASAEWLRIEVSLGK